MGSQSCFVKLLDSYLKFLPPASSYFYMQGLKRFPTDPLKSPYKTNEWEWTLSRIIMLPQLLCKADLGFKYTNHSLCATAITRTLMLHGNLAENWRRRKQCYTIYMMADGKTVTSEEIKWVIFLHLAGQDTLYLGLFKLLTQWSRWWQKARQATGEIWSLLHSMPKHHVEGTHIQHPKPLTR